MSPNSRLSSSNIRYLACLFMLIDHIGSCILFGRFNNIYIISRGIGRLAFPLFCFLLAEGVYYSRGAINYLARLLALAIISEPIFDFSHGKLYMDFSSQNTVFTLFISAIVLITIKRTANIPVRYARVSLNTCVILIGCILTYMIKSDYSIKGVLMCVFMYYLCRSSEYLSFINGAYPIEKQAIFLSKITCIFFLVLYVPAILKLMISSPFTNSFYSDYLEPAFNIQILAIFSIFIIMRYNGQKGSAMSKWIYYSFYPVHLLVLAAIKYFLL